MRKAAERVDMEKDWDRRWAAGQWRDLRRIRELRGEGVSNGWLWMVDKRKGKVLANHEYWVAVRHRLGQRVMGECSRCQECGKAIDAWCTHAGVCAKGERNVRHYAVARVCKKCLWMVDPRLTIEPKGLGGQVRERRPADILADLGQGWGEVALDIGVADQEAVYARDDCVREMVGRKRRYYGDIEEVLREMGVSYKPMIWSAEGRPHRDTMRIIGDVAAKIQEARGGFGVAREVKAEWHREVGTILQEARYEMIKVCAGGAAGWGRWGEGVGEGVE